MLPYLIQLFAVEMQWYAVLFLCMICEAWKLFEIFYEYIQYSVEGKEEYFTDINNLMDGIGFFSYQIYFVIRFFS